MLENDINKFKFHKTPFSPSFISSLTYNAENLMSSFEAAVVTSPAKLLKLLAQSCEMGVELILTKFSVENA